MKIQQTKTGQYTVTLPRQIVKSMRWEKGDELDVFVERGDLVLRKV